MIDLVQVLNMSIKPFQINVPQHILDHLHTRIQQTRRPDENVGSGGKFGPSLSYMKELADYWINVFNWRKVEKELTSYPNFLADITGYKIHFLWIKGKGEHSVPLLITHGWPGSVLELLKLIPILTNDHTISFDLIIPSIMGYGFSGKISKPGCNVYFIADLWYKLMKELGYDTFGVQGGDFGAGISTILALNFPQNVIGLHLNYIEDYYSPYLSEEEQLTEEENYFLKEREDWYKEEGGYSHQQRTKPLTLAYGLNDSPVGLCAWVIEKFYSWSDCEGNIENIFTKDELLANVTLYWITETIHSSIRLYNEMSNTPLHFSKDDFVKVPVGIAHFPLEYPFPPRKYIERGFNVKHWTDMPKGGHFASMEQPQLLAEDIKIFFENILHGHEEKQ